MGVNFGNGSSSLSISNFNLPTGTYYIPKIWTSSSITWNEKIVDIIPIKTINERTNFDLSFLYFFNFTDKMSTVEISAEKKAKHFLGQCSEKGTELSRFWCEVEPRPSSELIFKCRNSNRSSLITVDLRVKITILRETHQPIHIRIFVNKLQSYFFYFVSIQIAILAFLMYQPLWYDKHQKESKIGLWILRMYIGSFHSTIKLFEGQKVCTRVKKILASKNKSIFWLKMK